MVYSTERSIEEIKRELESLNRVINYWNYIAINEASEQAFRNLEVFLAIEHLDELELQELKVLK
jgi:hypothetical protein